MSQLVKILVLLVCLSLGTNCAIINANDTSALRATPIIGPAESIKPVEVPVKPITPIKPVQPSQRLQSAQIYKGTT